MENDGPVTGKFRSIMSTVEHVGHRFGIPQDQALMLVKIGAVQDLTNEIRGLRADETRWHKGGAKFSEVLMKGISYIAGLLKEEKN